MTAALLHPSDAAIADKDDWTVDDLASLPKDLRYELIDGRLVLPSPTGVHQDLGVRVLLALEANCPPDHLVVTDLSLKIRPGRQNEPRPDVVVISLRYADRSPVPAAEALLAVEIISPDSHFRDMYAKAEVYASAGIEHYWVIDPLGADGIVLTEYRRGGGGNYEEIRTTRDVFRADVPFPVTLDLPALTARRRAMLGAGDQS